MNKSSSVHMVDARRMAADARTLWEVIEDSRAMAHAQPAAYSGSGQDLLERWARQAANGDREALTRRLAWEGLAIDDVGRMALAGDWPQGRPLPDWIDTTREALADGEALSLSERIEDRCLSIDNPIPFDALLFPWVVVARRWLRTRAGDRSARFAPAAHASLERHLLAMLSEEAGPTLLAQLSLRRDVERWALERAMGLGGSGSGRYEHFVRWMLGGELAAVLVAHPVLARTLATVTSCWVDSTAELFTRLDADSDRLTEYFAGGLPIGTVSAVTAGQSDPHNGRRTVATLTFDSGLRLVYKPKNLSLDEAFCRLIDWLNAKGAPLDLRGARVLNLDSYGWAEYVDARPCTKPEEVARFYERAGMLLCLAYVLDATDCSQDNLIASGEYPVLIDLETLMHPRMRRTTPPAAGAEALAYDLWERSVLRTALLPSWEIRLGANLAIDRSGLGGPDADDTVPGERWRSVNTGEMDVEKAPIPLPRGRHRPVLQGEPVLPGEYVAEVVRGFSTLYRFLVEQRTSLLGADGPLMAFSRGRVRFIHRPTDVYYSLRRRLREPACTRSGIEQSLQLELLCRAFTRSQAPYPGWRLVAAERSALERGDIPYFTAAASDTSPAGLRSESHPLFEASPLSCVLDAIARMDEDDLARQILLIEGALRAYAAREIRPGKPAVSMSGSGLPSSRDRSAAAVDPADLLERVRQIAVEIERRAIHASDGSVTWIAPQFHTETERFLLRPLGPDIYAGLCGVALFLAAADRVLATADRVAGANLRALAAGALQAVREHLRSERPFPYLGLGAGTGLGSIVYALTTAGVLLDDESLVKDAARAARLVTNDRIAAERSADVLAGAAGAILGILALHRVTGDAEWIERASACGHRVVALAVPASTPSGARAWRTYRGRLLTGLSHGAAGISYALLRLAALTGDHTLTDLALEGLAYERDVFSQDARNWPDFRWSAPAYPVQWCHGAPGIALARMGSVDALDTPAVREDILTALETTLRADLQPLDHLCCGTMGRVETMLVASDRLRNGPQRADQHRSIALEWTSRVLSKADESGSFTLHPLLPPSVPNPTFFQGMAGIGYTLLRLAAPGRLPSVALWEAPAAR